MGGYKYAVIHNPYMASCEITDYDTVYSKTTLDITKHSIFTTSWKALYFYRIYFEAVTSMQKFANSFSKDHQKGGPHLQRTPFYEPSLGSHLYLGILQSSFEPSFSNNIPSSLPNWYKLFKTLNIYNFLESIIFL
jgi:hypothetical protein